MHLLFSQAIKQYQAGNFEVVEQLCRQTLLEQPNTDQAWHLLGLLAHQAANHDAAIDYLTLAIAINSANPLYHLDLGLVYGKTGRLEQAAQSYQEALRWQPDEAETYYLLAAVQKRLGQSAAAIQNLRQAINLDPTMSQAFYELGLLLATAKQWAEAEQCYRAVIRLQPTHAKAYYQLGGMCWQQQKIEAAVECFEQSLSLDPDQPLAYAFLGQGLAALGFRAKAIEQYEKALEARPDDAALHNNIGVALLGEKRHQEACKHFTQALALMPDRAVFHFNLGAVLEQLNQYEAARKSFLQAVDRTPGHPLWALKATGVCPAIAMNEEAIRQWRTEFAAALAHYPAGSIDLAQWLPELHHLSVQPPFNLHYHGLDDRALKEEYARLFKPPQPPLPPQLKNLDQAQRLRVGFLVTHGHESVFLKFMSGLIRQLDPRAFEPFVISHPGSIASIKGPLHNNQVQYLPIGTDLPGAIHQLRAAQLDLLYYWEVGTDALNYFLPFFRLAPVQCTSWGSPTTTGIPQMDYFISSALFEPAGAEAHYSEQLIRLKSFGTWYTAPQLPAPLKPRSYFGLAAEERVYLCVQNLNKYHHDFDPILGEILRRDSHGQLLIKANQPALDNLLRQRLQQTMPEVMPRIKFLPNLSYPDYLNLMAVADVLLDTPHYTGGTTAHESFAVGTPMVTWPGQFMRGRMTYGFYQKMGVLDTVVWNAEAYVSKAVQVTTDRAYQHQLRQRILASHHRVFEDVEAVRELEQFFRSAIMAAGNSAKAANSTVIKLNGTQALS